jgi:hypothetical protein
MKREAVGTHAHIDKIYEKLDIEVQPLAASSAEYRIISAYFSKPIPAARKYSLELVSVLEVNQYGDAWFL